MTFDKTTRLISREELVAVLQWAGGERLHERHILCPFHNDTMKSAEIRQSAATGRWYFYCHKCGIADDVWALQARVEGRDVGEILIEAARAAEEGKEPPKATPAPKKSSSEPQASNSYSFATIQDLISSYRQKMPQMVVEEINPYTNPDTGDIDLYVVRYKPTPDAKKQFLQATPVPGGWSPKGYPGDKKIPLFNRIRLAGDDRVLLVEGEKNVRAVTERGIENLVAGSSCGGSKAARRADWSPLAGKNVYIRAYKDDVGRA